MVYGEVRARECLKWSNSVGSPGIEGQTLANGVGLDVDSTLKRVNSSLLELQVRYKPLPCLMHLHKIDINIMHCMTLNSRHALKYYRDAEISICYHCISLPLFEMFSMDFKSIFQCDIIYLSRTRFQLRNPRHFSAVRTVYG